MFHSRCAMAWLSHPFIEQTFIFLGSSGSWNSLYDVDNFTRCRIDDDPVAIDYGITIGFMLWNRIQLERSGEAFSYGDSLLAMGRRGAFLIYAQPCRHFRNNTTN